MPVWVLALASVTVVSLTSLAGAVTLSLGPKRLQRLLFLLVAFAVGAMLGGALLHLIPEAYESLGAGPQTGLLVLAGVVAFFVLEKFLHWQHQHGAPEAIEGATGHVHDHGHSHGDPLAAMSIVGTVAHHLIDGAVVAAAYGVSVEAGLVTTLAVMAHEVPQQIGMFGILVYAGLSTRRALGLNLLAGLATLPGAILVLTLGGGASGDGFYSWLLPVTAGSFLYVAGSDLIPELNRRHSYPASKAVGQLAMMLLGIGLMAALLLVGAH
ncbi:MAG: ZIP family metal transporter [Bacteroidota bacterium]